MAVEEIQGFGLGSGLYGVRIAHEWNLQTREGRFRKGNAGMARASMKLDPGGGPGGDNGIGRVVVNLAIAGGLTYLTITGKLGWVFDAFVSLWVSPHCVQGVYEKFINVNAFLYSVFALYGATRVCTHMHSCYPCWLPT